MRVVMRVVMRELRNVSAAMDVSLRGRGRALLMKFARRTRVQTLVTPARGAPGKIGAITR